MLLKWNGKNVWSIGTSLNDGSVVQITPGPNELKKHEWDAIKNHPVVKARMEKDVIDEKRGMVKLLEIIVKKEIKDKKNLEPDDDGKDDDGVSLSSMSAPDAKALIGETFNVELLREWKESETRKGPLEAIEKQLEAIEKSREGDPGNDNDVDG